MRKLLVVIIILIGFTIGINLSRDQKGFRTYQEVLTELINDAPMKPTATVSTDTASDIRSFSLRK